MKHSRSALFAVTGAIALFLAFTAHAKKIRLQNETIETSAQPAAAFAPDSSQGQQGGKTLVLVQFAEPPSAETRRLLLDNSVELLTPIPEDAFIARAAGNRRAWLRSVRGVEWVGPYKPEHKVHKDLAGLKSKGGSSEIRVLLTPGISEPERLGIRGLLESVEQESILPLGTILKGRLSAGRLSALEQSEAVVWIEPAQDMKLLDEVSSKLVAGDAGPNALLTQSLGYDGSGVKVAVADSGLNNGDAETMHPDLLGRTPAFFYYGKSNQLFSAADEHSHGTHVAGIIAGNGATREVDENGYLYGLGVAPGAEIIAQKIFDYDGSYAPPPSSQHLTRDAKRAGADIGSNSWGDDVQGAYDLSAMEFDALVRDADALTPGDQPYILEFSAGNAGPAASTMDSPASAKNVIATGACESERTEFLIYGDGAETMADFSSRGPCKDGRIKPDVVAPGTYIASLQSASATDEYAWAPISPNYQYQGGTSQAGPHASGAAAVFVQYYRENYGATPSPAMVKAALINSAADLYDLMGTGPVPNMDEGWGRIDLPTLMDPALTFKYFDQSVLLTNLQLSETRFVVNDPEEFIKITLTYTDVPGTPSAEIALVNDLDLEVVAPDGRIYRGNQFLNGESIPNAPSADHINNVEGVSISAPIIGEYIVRVRATKVLADARRDTDLIDQDFALVISGGLAGPGQAVLAMDREFYKAPDTIKLFLVDTDLTGAQSVPVIATSGAEAGGEQVILRANGGYGAFTGAVATVAGPAVRDGKLQVADMNAITVTYLDASSGLPVTAHATADTTAPGLGEPAFQVQFASPQVNWTSSEEATSFVYFGTNRLMLNQVVSSTELTDQHSLSLGRIVPAATYYYYVVSADRAGNYTTNNNSGAYFTFNITALRQVLFVDAWPDTMDWPAPDAANWTNALKETGIDFDMIMADSITDLASLLPRYRAVVWRHMELMSDGWSSADRLVVSNYLNTGGALFTASMDLLTQLKDKTYCSNVLHVANFLTDEEDPSGVTEANGEPFDPVISGFSTPLDYSVYDDLWAGYMGFLPSDISDTMFPDHEASTMIFDQDGDCVGLRWPGIGREAPGRLVLLSFPFEAIPEAGGLRVDFMKRVMAFLAPGASRNATLAFSSAAYQVPGVAVLELGDSDLAGQPFVNLNVRSTSQPSGVTLTLRPAASAGQFRAALELTTLAEAGKLRVVNGDTITVDYFDVSAGVTRTATAMVDTVRPVVSDVFAEPEYVDAAIYWTTSEPADSLVLFGESPLLGRNSYTATLATDHYIGLSSLVPERTYYYKIISRDAAGNMTETNNAGELFTFSTKAPLRAPWSDNMDYGATNWTTYADPEMSWNGYGVWTLGTPANGLDATGHSPCWGSNLNGDPVDSVETFLISPAIYLTNSTATTLKFWHNYDFPDLIEFGYVEISVNNGPLQQLATYGDSSFGWTEETIDLTPFAGSMVYLVWHYGLLAFEGGEHPGWLVDDVSITSTPVQPGVLIVTNNLWQADYVLSGPLYRNTNGPTIISNAPPGDYTLEFAPVQYYQTPPTRSGTLSAGQTLVLSNYYSFADVNKNGISDAWELHFFNTVAPTRTRTTDSDGDSISDYNEFILGTDPRPLVVTAQRANANMIRLTWPSLEGTTYTIQSTTNLSLWLPVASVQATSSVSSVSLPLGSARSALFRVGTSSAAAQAPVLTLSRMPGGTLRFSWLAPTGARGCGCLIESSTDLRTWTPASPWIRPVYPTTMYDTTATANSKIYYRLRIEP